MLIDLDKKACDVISILMKHTQHPKKLALNRQETIDLLAGSKVVLNELLDSGLLKPVIARNRLTVFDHAQVVWAWQRYVEQEQKKAS